MSGGLEIRRAELDSDFAGYAEVWNAITPSEPRQAVDPLGHVVRMVKKWNLIGPVLNARWRLRKKRFRPGRPSAPPGARKCSDGLRRWSPRTTTRFRSARSIPRGKGKSGASSGPA